MCASANEAALPNAQRIPLWLKISYSAFVAVMVPYYWHAYGPTNFLYFCDVAVFFTLAAVWTESPLLASMPAVGILLPQTLWMIDFLGELVGLGILGMTAYMFDAKIPLFVRCISLFHFWLPLLLVWLVWRLGYDKRAFKYWTVFAIGLLIVCYQMPAPPAPADNPNLPTNINYVYGLSDKHPQTWMPPLAYLGLMLVGLPVVLYWPTHQILRLIATSGSVERNQL